MNVFLKIEMITLSILFLIFIIYMLKKENITIKYSVMWLLIPVLFLSFVIFSTPLIKISQNLGFEVLSNMIFVILFGIVFMILFSLTIIVSRLKINYIKISQELSMLKEKQKRK